MEEEKSKVNNQSGLSNKAITKNKLPDQVLSIEQLQQEGNATTKVLNHYLQMLSVCASKRREIETSNTLFLRELKDKIEKTMNLTPKEMPISELLSKILSDAVEFDVDKHFGLIGLLIEAIKVLANSRTSFLCKIPAATLLIEKFADFLYRLKDRHPYSNSEMKDHMDVFYMIMEFLIPNGYLPSAALLKEYSESKFTRELNTLPPLEYMNKRFCGDFVSEGLYEYLRKRFESRPPFVFYFNPNIELEKKVNKGPEWKLKIGFFVEGTDVSVNKLNSYKFKKCV